MAKNKHVVVDMAKFAVRRVSSVSALRVVGKTPGHLCLVNVESKREAGEGITVYSCGNITEDKN